MSVGEALRSTLKGHLSSISIDTVIERHVKAPALPVASIDASDRAELAERLVTASNLFSRTDPELLRTKIRGALGLDGSRATTSSPSLPLKIPIRAEIDVSVARNEARRVAVEAGASGSMAVKVATSVSELARNIVLYAGRGTIDLDVLRSDGTTSFEIVARDRGPGIDAAKLEAMFAGTYRSKSGLGKGLVAVKRIGSEFDLDTGVGKGTTVRVVFRGTT